METTQKETPVEKEGVIITIPITQAGKIECFNVSEDDFEEWSDQFTIYCNVNNIGESKRKNAFLTLIGIKIFKQLLRSMVYPKKLTEVNLEALKKLALQYVKPRPSELAMRIKFRTRMRAESETVSQFISQLLFLSESCNFGTTSYVNFKEQLSLWCQKSFIENEVI